MLCLFICFLLTIPLCPLALLPPLYFKKKKKKDTKKMKQGWRCVSSDSLRLPCKRKALNSNPSTTTKKYIYKPVEVW
jgi:hypothetical protein